MKARVNLTIEQDLLTKIKEYASNEGKSISELVERYFKQAIKNKQTKKSKIFEMVRNLPPIDLPEDFDFKKEYHEEKMKKHGF